MVYFTGIVITIFVALLLAGKRGKSQADYILLLWLLAIAFHLFLFYLYISGRETDFPLFLGWQFPLPTLQFSFLFLYISALTARQKLSLSYLSALLPTVSTIGLFSWYYIMPQAQRIEIFASRGKGYEIFLDINMVGILSFGLMFIVLSALKLWHYKKAIKDKFSSTEKINLNWLTYLLIGMSVIFIVVSFSGSDEYVFFTVVLFVVFIGFYGIRQDGIINHTRVTIIPEKADLEISLLSDTSNTKYQKTNLKEDTVQEIHQALLILMEKEELYTNPELTLDELADKLEVIPNYLSQVINSCEQKNFYDYINQLRVNKFVSLLEDPNKRQFTFLSLAYESGFNSKTSFNRNFKKITGFAPSEYMKEIVGKEE